MNNEIDKTIERVDIDQLRSDDIVVLGGVELQLTEVWKAHPDATRLYFEGDVFGVIFHANTRIYRVKRVVPTTFPAGTLIRNRSIIMVRTGKKDEWIRVTDHVGDDHSTGWTDSEVELEINEGKALDLLFNPNDTKEA